jgi:hypothetical protein
MGNGLLCKNLITSGNKCNSNSVSSPGMRQILAIAVLLLAPQSYGQDWRPSRSIPMMRYPCWALTAKVQGMVEFRFTLDKEGIPRDIHLIRGHPLLIGDAMAHFRSLILRSRGAKSDNEVRTARYIFRLDPARKSGTDLAATIFRPPNVIVVSVGYVKPSLPCPSLGAPLEKPLYLRRFF